jgi:hypothetical protein
MFDALEDTFLRIGRDDVYNISEIADPKKMKKQVHMLASMADNNNFL